MRVELAEDGFAAVEALEMAAEPFGLVLMDLMMPIGLLGLVLLPLLKECFQGIP